MIGRIATGPAVVRHAQTQTKPQNYSMDTSQGAVAACGGKDGIYCRMLPDMLNIVSQAYV